MDDKETTGFDVDKVDKIVARMKKKYETEGRPSEDISPNEALSRLRGTVSGTPVVKLEIQPVEELQEETNPFIRQLGMVFLQFRKFLGAIATYIERIRSMQELQYWLYSANLRYSARQWIAISVSLAAMVFLFTLTITLFAGIIAGGDLFLFAAILFLLPIFLGLLTIGVTLYYPKYKAMQRGVIVSTELPFALRHMATEIRAGIGLYRTIQTIASADYGPLSEEFSRVISEVEEGVDTKDALHNLSVRTQSMALRNSLRHISRALRTGGNLSEIISDIAEDVSFSLRENVRDYAQKMNFFGVIFIFSAIVAPVMITILGAIRNSPVSSFSDTFNIIPLTIPVLTLIYAILLPFMLVVFILYLRASQPRV
jgi:pilus assembly protein TadC